MSLKSTADFIIKLLSSKKFRDAYVAEHIRTGIPFQIRALRNERDWTQAKLGEAAGGKKQHGISRLENPNLGDELSIKSLLEIASAFDVALLVKFVPFSKLVREYENVSPSALAAASVFDEKQRLLRWAAAKDRADTQTVENTAPVALLRLVQASRSVYPSQLGLGFEPDLGDVARRTHASSGNEQRLGGGMLLKRKGALQTNPNRFKRTRKRKLTSSQINSSWAYTTARSAA